MSSYIRTIQKRIMKARKIKPALIVNAKGLPIGNRMPLLAHHVAYDVRGNIVLVKTNVTYTPMPDRQKPRKGPARGSRRGKRTVDQVKKAPIVAVPASAKPTRSKTQSRELHSKKMEMKAAFRDAMHARGIGKVHPKVIEHIKASTRSLRGNQREIARYSRKPDAQLRRPAA